MIRCKQKTVKNAARLVNQLKKKEYVLSISEVKNILKNQSKEELIKLVIDSYKAIPELKEYITIRYAKQEEIEQIAEAYKNKIFNVFFPKNINAPFKISNAKKVISDFKKLCSDEKIVLDLMLYFVEMGIEFTCAYGDINEGFYDSVEGMYKAVVSDINKCKDSEIFNIYKDRIKAVIKNTKGIGWGFHEELKYIYSEIKWLNLEEFDIDQSEMKNIKEYISNRLRERKDIPDLNNEKSIDEVISYVIDTDEIFLSKMESQGFSFSSDDEYDFIQERTGYSFELVEFILWQRYCYEMENDYWTYDRDKCRKCGSSELYLREVPNVDFADKVICKMCGTEFIRN